MALKKTTKQFRREIGQELKRLGLTTYSKEDKPVQTPRAEIVKPYKSNNGQKTNTELIMSGISSLKVLDRRVYYLALLQLETGARISELLNIKLQDVSKLHKIRLRGLKNSNNRYISGNIIATYLDKCRTGNIAPFFDLDYYYIRRCYLKVGIFSRTGNKYNKSVTHVIRHMYIKEAQTVGMPLEEIAVAVGHKTSKSTKGYADQNKV